MVSSSQSVTQHSRTIGRNTRVRPTMDLPTPEAPFADRQPDVCDEYDRIKRHRRPSKGRAPSDEPQTMTATADMTLVDARGRTYRRQPRPEPSSRRHPLTLTRSYKAKQLQAVIREPELPLQLQRSSIPGDAVCDGHLSRAAFSLGNRGEVESSGHDAALGIDAGSPIRLPDVDVH